MNYAHVCTGIRQFDRNSSQEYYQLTQIGRTKLVSFNPVVLRFPENETF